MPGIRWGKFSGKNRGGACNGAKGRKCEKTECKDAAKGKEGEGLKKRGLLRSQCAKSSVVNDVLIEIKSNPHLNSKSLQEEGMVKKIDACEIKGKPNPNSNILQKAVIKKIDVCEIKSKSNVSSKSLQGVGVFKKVDSCEKGVDGNLKCKDNWDVQQGMWDNECMEDVKQGKGDSECMKNANEGMWDSEYVKQGILDMEQGSPNSGHMLHVGLNATSVKKDMKADSYDAGGDAESTDSTESLVFDKSGDANCVALTQTNFSIGLDSESMKDNLYEKRLGVDGESMMIPHDFVCGISKKVMEDPVVVASGLTFERAYIQAWLNEGNTLCPITHKPLSHLELIPNLTLKALISSWYSQSHDSGLESAHHSFSSCVSSFTSCPSLMQSFISCSSFSVSKLVEETELYSYSSSSASSLPKLLMDAEPHSFSSSSVSAPSYDTPEHLRAAGIHNFPSTPSSISSPSSFWEQEREVLSLQESTFQSVKSMHEKQGEEGTVMAQRCHLHSKSTDSMLQSAEPCDYIVSRINSLVSDLRSEYLDIQRSAAAELRLLAKNDDNNRLMIASGGALRPLVALIWSRDQHIQLEATTTLLNLSLNHSLKDNIVKEGAIEALVWVLRDGFSTVAKENAAVTLACLAINEENKIKIGSSSVVKPLVNLLERGSPRGKKDAAAALYRLSSNDENKRRIVRAGASRPLVGFMSIKEDKDGMVDKAIAILGNLVSIEEGRVSFVEEKGILSLMQVLQTGSERSKGLAISILSQLCIHSSKHRSLVLQKEPLPTLMALSKTGNTRLKTQVAEVIQVLIVDAD